MAAAVALVVGGAAVAQQFLAPGADAADSDMQLRQIRQANQRAAEAGAGLVQPSQGVVRVAAGTPGRPIVTQTGGTGSPGRRMDVTLPLTLPRPVDPTEDIALQAVTTEDGKSLAWLLKISDRSAEEAAEGEMAFGFKVTSIASDAVVLEQDGKSYNLRLGEKHIPVIAPTVASSADASPAASTSSARRNDGRRGGDRGGSSSDRDRRRREWMARMASFRSRGSSSSRNRSSNSRSRYSSSRGDSRSRSSSNRGRSSRRRPDMGNMFRGTVESYRYQRSAQRQYNETRSSFSSAERAGSYANPQSARRTGGTFTGGATAGDGPSTIVNPQTQRRTGQATSGAGGNTGATFGGGGSSDSRSSDSRR